MNDKSPYWQECRLKDIVDKWIIGTTPRTSEPEYYDAQSGIPWVRVEDMATEYIAETKQYITRAAEAHIRKVPEGAVLVSTVGTIGKVAVAKRELCTNQAIQSFVFKENLVLPRYMYYYFQFLNDSLHALSNRFTIPNLTKKNLEELVISYPVISEQRYIIDKLDKAFMIRQMRGNVIRELEEYLPALLKFYLNMEKQEKEMPLDKIAEIKLMKSYKKDRIDKTGEIYYVNGFDQNDFLLDDMTGYGKLKQDQVQDQDDFLKSGDILVPRYLTATNGVCLYVDKDTEQAVVGSGIIRIRLKSDTIAPEFLYTYLRCLDLSNYYGGGFIGQKRMLLKQFQKQQIPLINDRAGFSRAFARFRDLYRRIMRSEKILKDFTDSMLYAAFDSSLSEQWRNLHEDEIIEELEQGTGLSFLDDGPVEVLFDEPESVAFLRKYLAPYQQEILNLIRERGQSVGAHMLVADLSGGYDCSMQEVSYTLLLFEHIGFIEKMPPQLIQPETDNQETMDNSSIKIQLYQLTDLTRDEIK